jgi:ABC-type bacteriocin/lantibiotic exporter with double-glycine peptidase domain
MKLFVVLPLIYLICLSSGAAGTPSPLVPPSHHLIEDVPYIRQEREHCGPASLAMVLGHYNVILSQEELAEEFYRKEISGSLNLDLLISARRHGFDAEVPEGSRSLLKKYVSRNTPIIVMVRSAPGKYHFMVIFGYDDTEELFRVHSGKKRNGTIDYQELDRIWAPTGKWMLVVERREWGMGSGKLMKE